MDSLTQGLHTLSGTWECSVETRGLGRVLPCKTPVMITPVSLVSPCFSVKEESDWE